MKMNEGLLDLEGGGGTSQTLQTLKGELKLRGDGGRAAT